MESVGDVAERAGDVVRLTIDLSAYESNDGYRVAASIGKQLRRSPLFR
jgi:hypothetical protein